jgi:hypothetical protein
MPVTAISTLNGLVNHRLRRPALTLLVVAACAVVALMLIGARPHEAPGRTIEVAPQTPPAERSAAERAWNENEDLKAARYVGQPGIY